MWKCLKCETEHDDATVQCTCGFDESRNYVKYSVLSPIVKEEMEAAGENLIVKNNKKYWMNWIHAISAELNALEENESKEFLGKMKEYFSSFWEQKKQCYQFDASFLISTNAERGKCDSKTRSRWSEIDFEPSGALEYTLDGNYWYFGIGRECNYFNAVLAYKKADELSYLDGTNNLGNCFFYGKGVAKDYSAAVSYYEKAASQGHMAASYNLGYCYEYGYGVEKNTNQAVTYYINAADQGLLMAQRRLGEYYLDQDIDKAIYWYEKAVEAGDAQSKMFLKMIQKVEKK